MIASMARERVGVALLAAWVGVAGCNALWGIDALDYDGRGGSSSTTSSTTSSTSSATSSASGGGGAAGAGGSGGSAGAGAVCGNGIIEGDEQCDDGNDQPLDGCHQCDVECDDPYDHEDPLTHHCYRVPPAQSGWLGARDACVTWGGYLASVTSEQENLFVKPLVSAHAWIGASDRASEGQFVWESGEPWSYTDWGPNQPDDYNGEDCVHIRVPENDWNDAGCATLHDMVCERPPPQANAQAR